MILLSSKETDKSYIKNTFFKIILVFLIPKLNISSCFFINSLLFHACTAVIYTPSNEHFGIVPLEAMLLGRPVLACNTGGPLETVIDQQTGFLCDAEPQAFAQRMLDLAKDRSLARELGVSAAEHVKRNFSFDGFAKKLDDVVQECVK